MYMLCALLNGMYDNGETVYNTAKFSMVCVYMEYIYYMHHMQYANLNIIGFRNHR